MTMEVKEELQENDRVVLLAKFQDRHDCNLIKDALSRKYCYRVHIYRDDFDDILINSSTEDCELAQGEYPTLRSVIDAANRDPRFFNRSRQDGGLSGIRVKQLYDEFTQDSPRLEPCFLVDRVDFPEMNKEAQFYVLDGMHRLVAYRLASRMRDECFPIEGYYCSNKHPVA